MDKLQQRLILEVKAKIIGDAEVVLLSNRRSLPEIREEIKEYAKSDEDVNVRTLPTTSERFLRSPRRSILRCKHYKQ